MTLPGLPFIFVFQIKTYHDTIHPEDENALRLKFYASEDAAYVAFEAATPNPV